MSLLKIAIAALSIAAVRATPLPPSKVARQEPPAPSSFPLGEPCGNEWQYLNFDQNDETQRKHVQMLHDVICMGELRALAAWGGKAAEDSMSSINVAYDVFFDTSSNAAVNDVLMKIAGASSSEGMIGTIVGTMVVDNNNFGVNNGNDCRNEGLLAYTDVDTADGREKIHFCDIAYKRPISGPAIDCGTLDTFPSEKMDTFSRVALHETLHYSSVGPPSQLGEQIIDAQNADGNDAYGAQRAHGLADPDQDDQPGLAEANADNYAYMALTAWVGYNCSPENEKEFYDSYFPDDPPAY